MLYRADYLARGCGFNKKAGRYRRLGSLLLECCWNGESARPTLFLKRKACGDHAHARATRVIIFPERLTATNYRWAPLSIAID